MKKLKIALDVDDVLYECNRYAVDLLNKEKGTNYRFEDIKSWGLSGTGIDDRLKYYNDPSFFRTQPLIDGAKEFVEELCRIAEVFIVTAVNPKHAGTRLQRIIDDFPCIDPGNVLITSRKDIVHVDVLLDDGGHNISSSIADYPVLMRRPWNSHISGILSVNNYKEFMVLLKTLMSPYSMEGPYTGNKVYAFLGSSGCGKTSIITSLDGSLFQRARSCTTRARRIADQEPKDAYCWVSDEEFTQMNEQELFFETTCYGGHRYGTTLEELTHILDNGKNAVIALDACGCMAVKRAFGERAEIVYVNRSKEASIISVLNRSGMSNEEKARRIVYLDMESRNEILADYVIQNDGSLDDSVLLFEAHVKSTMRG